jgi:hypothetical protein
MTKWKFLALCVILSPLIHWFQAEADSDRFSKVEISDRFYIPKPDATSALSLGQQTMVADLLWIRTVLIFSDIVFHCNSTHGEWLVGMIRTITKLDPAWKTVYQYGGLMMGVCQDHDASDQIFELGHEQFPEAYFFPAAIGMNAYSDHKDYEKAAHWMKIASTKERAPEWYRRAVAGMLNEDGQRSVAIEYLEQELASSTDETIRKKNQRKLNRLYHEDFLEQITVIQKQKEELLGRKLRDISEIEIVQVDPFGEGWVLAPDGVIRSLFIEREELDDMQSLERIMLKKR